MKLRPENLMGKSMLRCYLEDVVLGSARDILKYSGIVLRRNTLCRWGIHKVKDRVETLALGEVLHSPVCEVYGCAWRGKPSLDLPNDGNNGTFLDLDSGNPVGRGFDPQRRERLGL